MFAAGFLPVTNPVEARIRPEETVRNPLTQSKVRCRLIQSQARPCGLALHGLLRRFAARNDTARRLTRRFADRNDTARRLTRRDVSPHSPTGGYLLPVTCYLLPVTCYLLPVTSIAGTLVRIRLSAASLFIIHYLPPPPPALFLYKKRRFAAGLLRL
jgi:hypothetical protein